MTTYLVTRHSGALAWFERRGFDADETLAHLDLADVRPGDVIVGTLPVNLAAAVSEAGARYLHLCVLVPEELRGKELSANQLDELGATLREFTIRSSD